jgi:Flp pilus assembly protein TadD
MSLLLDALKSTDSSAAVVAEPEEEPLDAQATLELLAQKPTAQARLALVPTSDIAAAPLSDFAPELVAEVAPAAPSPELAPLSIAGRTDEIVAAPAAAATATAPSNALAAMAAPANARATVAVPPAMPSIKKYGLLLAALVAFAGIGIVGKSLWPFGSNAVIYPQRREPQQVPASTDPAPAPSAGAVQVPSARPADQFAYAGNAPEIDLRDAEIRPAATSEPAPPASAIPPTAPAATGTASVAAISTTDPAPSVSVEPAARTGDIRPSSMRPSVTRSAATHSSTLSVTRTEGPSSIDRHVAAGYRALAAGNVATAQNEYVAALELDPNNVDAILGLATIAARDGRSKAAAAAYANVLKLEPGNPDATAAMAMLGSNGSAGESNESRLKILIAGDDGGRPSLHAALGGVYAADGRWTEAAQEYFVALGKDPGNPDLAFNVAASLDQNRNYAAALNFYGQALAFARQRPTQIDLNAIEQRISQLQARGDVRAPSAPGTP